MLGWAPVPGVRGHPVLRLLSDLLGLELFSHMAVKSWSGPTWMFPGLRVKPFEPCPWCSLVASRGRWGEQIPSQAAGSCGQLCKHTMSSQGEQWAPPQAEVEPFTEHPPSIATPLPKAGEYSAPSVLDDGECTVCIIPRVLGDLLGWE